MEKHYVILKKTHIISKYSLTQSLGDTEMIYKMSFHKPTDNGMLDNGHI